MIQNQKKGKQTGEGSLHHSNVSIALMCIFLLTAWKILSLE